MSAETEQLLDRLTAALQAAVEHGRVLAATADGLHDRVQQLADERAGRDIADLQRALTEARIIGDRAAAERDRAKRELRRSDQLLSLAEVDLGAVRAELAERTAERDRLAAEAAELVDERDAALQTAAEHLDLATGLGEQLVSVDDRHRALLDRLTPDVVRRAIADPGAVVGRRDSDQESLPAWQTRAVLTVLGLDEARPVVTVEAPVLTDPVRVAPDVATGRQAPAYAAALAADAEQLVTDLVRGGRAT